MDTTTTTRPPTTTSRPGLAELVSAIGRHTGGRHSGLRTARLVAETMAGAALTADLLTLAERQGSPDTYVRHVLHHERTFSLAAVVWRPGQETVIHDHVAWCAVTVLQGIEHEIIYLDRGTHLERIGEVDNHTGSVSCFAPPGDIHRVHNIGDTVAISLHAYGADLGQGDSSVRRVYDLPVVGA